jgi:hypothetical protein
VEENYEEYPGQDWDVETVEVEKIRAIPSER